MMGGGGTSAYMQDLIEKLNFVRNGVLARYNVGDLAKEWYVRLRDILVYANDV